MYVCCPRIGLCWCPRMSEGSDPPELKWQTVVSLLKLVPATELSSSTRVLHDFECWAISPTPKLDFFNQPHRTLQRIKYSQERVSQEEIRKFQVPISPTKSHFGGAVWNVLIKPFKNTHNSSTKWYQDILRLHQVSGCLCKLFMQNMGRYPDFVTLHQMTWGQ